MNKANFDEISSNYDAGRELREEVMEEWLNKISEKIGHKKDVKLLDLACGTGRFAIPISAKLGYQVIGADMSTEMMAQAKQKLGAEKVMWEYEDANNLRYPNSTFDAVFISFLLNNVEHPLKIIQESYRVLKPQGVLICRYSAMEDLEKDPEHHFFPEAIMIDKERTPTKQVMEDMYNFAGLKNIETEVVNQKTYQTPRERFEKVKLKPSSLLRLISKSAFEQGIKKYQQAASNNSADEWFLYDKIALTTGKK